GQYPAAGLFLHPNGFLYGTTRYGGTYDAGTVFKIAKNANQTTAYTLIGTFDDTNGAEPAAELIVGSDGDTLFGTTSDGGNGFGAIFSIASNGGLMTIHTFSG